MPLWHGQIGPRYMVGRIYKEDYLTLLHTNIKAMPFGVREEDFFKYSYCYSVGASDPRGVANLDHMSMIGRIRVGYH